MIRNKLDMRATEKNTDLDSLASLLWGHVSETKRMALSSPAGEFTKVPLDFIEGGVTVKRQGNWLFAMLGKVQRRVQLMGEGVTIGDIKNLIKAHAQLKAALAKLS